jgi:hypothetical protein
MQDAAITYVEREKKVVQIPYPSPSGQHACSLYGSHSIAHPMQSSLNGYLSTSNVRTSSLILSNNIPNPSILIFEQNIFLLNPSPYHKGRNHYTYCFSNHYPIHKRVLEKTWRTNRPNCAWCHCCSAIPGQGIQS